MDLSSVNASPVLADPVPINQTILGFHSSVFSLSSGTSFPLLIPKKKPGKLDDVRSNGWLDAMQSSSPPRKKMLKDVGVELACDDNDLVYYSWMVCLDMHWEYYFFFTWFFCKFNQYFCKIAKNIKSALLIFTNHQNLGWKKNIVRNYFCPKSLIFSPYFAKNAVENVKRPYSYVQLFIICCLYCLSVARSSSIHRPSSLLIGL